MQDMLVRAEFVAMNVKTGKTVMQFELDPEDISMMTELAKAVGEVVALGVHRGQAELPLSDVVAKVRGTRVVNRETGEVLATAY